MKIILNRHYGLIKLLLRGMCWPMSILLLLLQLLLLFVPSTTEFRLVSFISLIVFLVLPELISSMYKKLSKKTEVKSVVFSSDYMQFKGKRYGIEEYKIFYSKPSIDSLVNATPGLLYIVTGIEGKETKNRAGFLIKDNEIRVGYFTQKDIDKIRNTFPSLVEIA